jgi:transposase
MLTPDHPARTAWAFACGLDLGPLYAAVRAVEGHPGRPHIDPRLLFALWLYATLDGVGSARALRRLCAEHTAYRWICGGVSVNYHSLADFRVEHGELLDALLTESVAALMHEGLVSLETVAQDGMRVRASAGADTFRRKPTLQERLAQARAHVAALKRQEGEGPAAASARQQAAQRRAARERVEHLEAALAQMPALEASREAFEKGSGWKARASTTDAEARLTKMPDGGFRPAYNLQFATDVGSGLVVDATAVGQATDNGQLGPCLLRVEARYGHSPTRVLVDAGFGSRDDVQAAHTAGVEVLMPVKEERKKRERGQDPFAPRRGDKPGVAAWRQRMGTAWAQALYKRRAATAEWVNAGCRNRGLYQVRVRGLAKVRCVALWQALAHNLLRAEALRQEKSGRQAA